MRSVIKSDNLTGDGVVASTSTIDPIAAMADDIMENSFLTHR